MGTTTENIRARVSLVDQMTPGLGRVAAAIGGAALAWKTWSIATDVIEKSIEEFSSYESSMVGIKSLVETTGRDYAKTIEAMTGQMGGLASQTAIAETFLKGLTTELDVDQINQMTTAVRNASIAMGEDFNVQLPLIIKAIKQLNPAILDNIGVTVRLDRVNKKITDGFYGMNCEINEATQQNAIFNEIMRQTAKFGGLEAAALDTTKGKMQLLSAQTSDLYKTMGELLNPAVGATVKILTGMVTGIDNIVTAISDSDIAFTDLTNSFDDLEKFKEEDSSFIAYLTAIDTWLTDIVDPIIPDAIKSIDTLITTMNNVPDFVEIIRNQTDAKDENVLEKLFGADKIAEIEDKYTDFSRFIKDTNRDMGANAADATNVLAVQYKGKQEEMGAAHSKRNQKAIDEINEYTETAIWDAESLAAADADWGSANAALVEEATTLWNAYIATRITDMDRMRNVLTRTMKSTSNRLVGSMKFLQTESSGVFRNMAADFSTLFIEEILSKMTTFLVPQLLGILGSIFDTRANDMMMVNQGRHAGQFFTEGFISEVNPDSMSLVFSKATEFDSEISRQNLTGGSNVAIY